MHFNIYPNLKRKAGQAPVCLHAREKIVYPASGEGVEREEIIASRGGTAYDDKAAVTALGKSPLSVHRAQYCVRRVECVRGLQVVQVVSSALRVAGWS